MLKRITLVVLAVLCLVLTACGAVTATPGAPTASTNNEAPKENNASDTQASTAPTASDAEPGYKKGQRFPDMTLTDLDGNEVTLYAYLGHPIYLNAFTSWCGYCIMELPDMIQTAEAHPDATFILVDIQEDAKIAKQFITEHGLPDDFVVLLADDWAFGDYNIDGVPVSFVLDEDAVVVDTRLGMADLDWMQSNMEAAAE